MPARASIARFGSLSRQRLTIRTTYFLKVLQLPGSEGLPFLTGCQEIPLAADLTSCSGFVQIMLNEIRNGQAFGLREPEQHIGTQRNVEFVRVGLEGVVVLARGAKRELPSIAS